MPVRTGTAQWEGDLRSGKGVMTSASKTVNHPYSFSTRFEEAKGTNPEELIAAAHAGCFTMALSNILSQNGHTPDQVHTEAHVHLTKGEDGFGIHKIELNTTAKVPGISKEEFLKHAENAKKNCPVSKLVTGAEVILQAQLK